MFQEEKNNKSKLSSSDILDIDDKMLVSGNNKNDDKMGYHSLIFALKNEIVKHKRISFSMSDWVDLLVGCSASKKLNKLYNVGFARLNADLNLIRILKKLRHLDIITNCSSLLKTKER